MMAATIFTYSSVATSIQFKLDFETNHMGATQVMFSIALTFVVEWCVRLIDFLGLRNVMRSNATHATKDFGSIGHLPKKPRTKKTILQRYNGFVAPTKHTVPGTDKENMPNHNIKMTEKYIVRNICEEVKALYGEFGIKPVTDKAIKDKILKVRREYQKAQKNAQAKARLNLEEPVSFKAKVQPRGTLSIDIEWYDRVLQGSPGCLGSVDRTSHKRNATRERLHSRSRNENLDLNFVRSDLTIEGSDTDDEELQNLDEVFDVSPIANTSVKETDLQNSKRRCCRHLDWSPVVKAQCRLGISSEGVQIMYDAFNIHHVMEVKKILQNGIKEGWRYHPAAFKGRLSYNFTQSQLCSLDVSAFIAQPGFTQRMFCSPHFRHLDHTMEEICRRYEKNETAVWQNISKLIPAHNQGCERLIGDLKLSHDVDTLITINSSRQERPRTKGNVNKA